MSFDPNETSSFLVEIPNEENEGLQIGPWLRKSTSVPYANPWIQVEHHEVKDPAGRSGVYGVVRFKHTALGCVPLHADGTVTLVGQHRYPLNEWSWEIPEGGGRKDHPLLEEIQRELREETGLSAQEWIPLGRLHTSNSVCDETAHLWLARGLTEGSNQLDSTEGDLKVKRVPLSEAVEMALDGRLTDAISVAALVRAARWLESHPA
jgi:8-oxo-dGTP pyrophosphatase MutT (NUDIX family)